MASLTPRIDRLDAKDNLLINGAFNFWQRGSSVALSGSNTYLADRFACFSNVTGMVGTQALNTDVPTVDQAGFPFTNCWKITATTGATATGNEGVGFFQRIEGYNYARIHGGKKICVQFWVKAKKTGTMGVQFSTGATSRRYVTSITVNAADTWERKRVNLTSDVTGTWAFDSSTGLNVGFMLDAAGTRLTSTLNEWFTTASSLFGAPTTQTHFLSANNDYVQFTGIQLVSGNYDEDFDYVGIDAQQEFSMCQRYYEKTYNLNVAPGTINADGQAALVTLADSTTSTLIVRIPFSVTKRSDVNSVTFYNRSSGNTASWEAERSNGGALTLDANVAVTSSGSTEYSFGVRINGSVSLAIGDAVRMYGHWAADAEL